MREPNKTSGKRLARIAEIRRQIAAGTYETPEKLARALQVFVQRQVAERQHPGSRPIRQEEK